MKIKGSIIALSIATLVAASPALFAGKGGHGGNGNNNQSVSESQLSQEETELLLFMREEEKLARDVYGIVKLIWLYHTYSFCKG